jgi:hypothetical protein
MRPLVPFLIVLVGCGGERPVTEPATAPVDAAVATAEPSDSATQVAEQPSSDTPAPVVGHGACVADDDCVLTRFQPGCCAQACDPYAISQAELDSRVADDQCESPCPPPSPCRGPRQTFARAVCHEGVCAAQP